MHDPASSLSRVSGPRLCDEPDVGSLTLPGFLRELTSRHAAREALVLRTPQHVVRWSYAELWQRASEVACALLACGFGRDQRVGVMMTNRPEWLASFFGVGLAGGVAVPLSTFSTAAELDYLLQAASVETLLFEHEVAGKCFTDMLCALEPALLDARPGELSSLRYPFLRRCAVVGEPRPRGAIEPWEAWLARAERVAPAQLAAAADSVRPSDTGALFFSSGSTDRPKGIFHTHRGMALQCWRSAPQFQLQDDVRCWTPNSFAWSGNFVMAIGGCLHAGGSLVLQRVFEPTAALALIEAERVTLPIVWPHQWAALEAAPSWRSADLSSLVYVDARTPAARHPSVHTQWVEPRWSYGSTETFTISAGFPTGTPPDIAGDSHGVPRAGNTLQIIDPVRGQVVARGVRGEIVVKGPTLMQGYLGVPLADTLDASGFFHTGDLGYIDELGRLHWEGRTSEMIKTGGANVSPAEVDKVVLEHPAIKLCKTIGVPHATLGEEVVTCVVAERGHALEIDGLQAFLKAQLASYKVPRRIILLEESDFVLTGSSGKIRADALRDLVKARSAPQTC